MLTLIDHLKQVTDFRELKGIRHPLWLVLLLVIMATMSGHVGYRACGDFVKRHEKEIISSFNLPKSRVPSYGTIRRVIMGVNYEELINIFNNWAGQYVNKNELEWIAADGKALKNTVTNYDNNSQSFVNIVSLFSTKKGVVIALKKFDSKTGSEIHIVQNLIEALDLSGVVITLDAVHCQTETIETIIDSKCDYVIPVKENQPLLRKAILNITENNQPNSVFIESEKTRDRKTTRTVSIFYNNQGIAKKWKRVKTVIKVERNGIRGTQTYHEVVYYISSLVLDAKKFAAGIRGHWGIENKLHYVKDVILKEDNSPITQINAATNFSILTTIAINLLRSNDYSSITKAIRQVGNDWVQLCNMIA